MKALFLVPPPQYNRRGTPVDRVYGCNHGFDYKPPIHLLQVATWMRDLGWEITFFVIVGLDSQKEAVLSAFESQVGLGRHDPGNRRWFGCPALGVGNQRHAGGQGGGNAVQVADHAGLVVGGHGANQAGPRRMRAQPGQVGAAPSASTAADSSVGARAPVAAGDASARDSAFSSALDSVPRRKACGVSARQRPSRGTVSATRTNPGDAGDPAPPSPVARFIVSVTGSASRAPLAVPSGDSSAASSGCRGTYSPNGTRCALS